MGLSPVPALWLKSSFHLALYLTSSTISVRTLQYTQGNLHTGTPGNCSFQRHMHGVLHIAPVKRVLRGPFQERLD